MTVLDGLARHLAAEGVASYDPEGTAYDGTEAAIFLYAVPDYRGPIIVLSLYPGPEVDGEDPRNPWRSPRLQVRTRNGRDPRAAPELDQAVHAVLHALGPVVLPDGTNLQDCYSLQSAPMPLGQDATGRWDYSRNYQLHTDHQQEL